jgi:serine/threonine protein kinase
MDQVDMLCAVKIVHKDQEAIEAAEKERALLQSLPLNKVVRESGGIFSDQKWVYMLQEFLPGGDLFTHLAAHQKFPPSAAQFYAGQIVLALEFLHSHHIVYRDLKPENLLMAENGYLKLTDFGFASKCAPSEMLHTKCGTPEYIAPEILANNGEGHCNMVDWWSFGVLVYEMLVGQTPFFSAESQTAIYKNILTGKVPLARDVDPVASDMIMRFLTRDPAQRFGSFATGGPAQVKTHRFFQGVVWHMLANQEIPAPLVPQLSSIYDTCYFSDFSEEEISLHYGTEPSVRVVCPCLGDLRSCLSQSESP